MIGSGTALGSSNELVILPVIEVSDYIYFKVNNESELYGQYELYVDQIDYLDILSGAIVQTSIEYAAESIIKAFLGIGNESSNELKTNANRAAIALVSRLQGKSLSGMTKNMVIGYIPTKVPNAP